MNHRHVIYICAGFLVLLWLAGGTIPFKLAVLEEEPRVSYDNFITGQEFALNKKRTVLEKTKSSPHELKINLDEQLAFVLWSERKYDEALPLYQNAKTAREKLHKGFDPKLVDTLISLAGLYRDMDKLDDSIDYYERVWQLDKANLPAKDIRLARDQTSMAVIAYVCGETQQDDKKHQTYMNNCLLHINDAQKILQEQKTPQSARLANLLYLKYLAFRELGNVPASKECHQAADYLTKQMQRPYKLPWT